MPNMTNTDPDEGDLSPGGRQGAGQLDEWSVPRLAVLARRLPFTITLLAAMLIAGAASGTMFRPISRIHGLLRHVGYGVHALQHGQIWTVLTSIVFTWQPWMLQTITLSVLLFVLPLELIAGTRKTAIVFLGSHVLGYFLTSILVSWPLAALGSSWGEQLARARDVGASAGAFGCAAALTWYLPWRLIRPGQIALAAYLGFWLLATHRIWDVEHAIAAVTGGSLGYIWARGRVMAMGAAYRRAQHWDQPTIRQVMAAVAAVVGLMNLASVILSGANRLVPNFAAHVPVVVIDGSRSFVTLAGFLLILLARGLAQGRRTAWLAGIILLEGSAIAHILKGLHIPEAVIASLAALVLATQSDAFRIRPDVWSLTRAARSIALFAAGFIIYAGLGLYSFRDEFSPAMSSGEAIEEFFARLVFLSSNTFRGDTDRARWFLNSLSIVWVGLIVYTAVVLLRPRLRPHEVSPDDRVRADEILHRYGRGTTSPMTLWPGNTVLLSADRRAYLSYRLTGDVALVLGDPIGPHDALRPLIDEFLAHCASAGWTPCFYGVTPRALDRFTRRGFATVQVAEDAIVWLEGLEFKGKKWQDVRSAINKANREGIGFRWYDQLTGDAAIRDQLWEISTEWLAEKGLPEMGFTLGTLTDPPDPSIRTAIAIDGDGRVHAFVTWLPIYAEHGWVIDLMRRRPDAFKGAMEFLIAQSAMAFRDEGAKMFSLAAAPLAHIERPGEDISALQRGLDLIAERLDAFYHFSPLFEFKRKFDPAWSPLYLAYPGLASLPKITLAIVRAYLPNLSVADVAAQLGAAAVSLPRRLIPTGRASEPADEPADEPIGTVARPSASAETRPREPAGRDA